MYIFEIFVKWLNKNKRGNSANFENIYKEGVYLNEEGDAVNEADDININCKHKFMPVDSTGNTLACINCGIIIKQREYKAKDKS